MSRSAADATRFTATSPHAFSKPSTLRSNKTFSPSSAAPNAHSLPQRSQPPPSSSGPESSLETPKQKIARLRAAHEAQKVTQISRWDKIVVGGRVWADRAHKVTTLTLIGLTVVAAGVTFFSLGDMILYNRRKRNAFYAEQHQLWFENLREAREAAAMGTADEDQILIINRQRAAEEAEEAKKNKKGMWSMVKGVFSTEGMQTEDFAANIRLGGKGVQDVGEESVASDSAITPASSIPVNSGDQKNGSIMKAVEEKRRAGERALQDCGIDGGPLDKLAEHAAVPGKAKGGWTSWMTSK